MRRLLLPLTVLAALLGAAPAGAQDQIQICHATGNPENPYASLTLDNAGALEHINHEDDLVPAPVEGCPATTVVLPDDTPTPTATPEYSIPTPTATATPAPTVAPRPPRVPRDRRDPRDDDDAGGVQGAGGSGGGGPAGTSASHGAQPSATDTRSLPMTGAEIWLIAAAGIGLLLSGAGVRLLSPAAGRPPGPSGR